MTQLCECRAIDYRAIVEKVTEIRTTLTKLTVYIFVDGLRKGGKRRILKELRDALLEDNSDLTLTVVYDQQEYQNDVLIQLKATDQEPVLHDELINAWARTVASTDVS